MSNKKLEVWEPIEGFKDSLHFTSMTYEDGLTFIFTDDLENEFHIVYDQNKDGMYVWSVRFTEEFKRGDLVQIAADARKEFFGSETTEWCFYKMINSDFMRWHDQLSGPGSDVFAAEHHLFMTTTDTFEVLSEYEPKIIVRKKD
ncbi:hypothetical protein FLK61_27390 [Paenalkalicoccus suaedae]|uniref:Uncharacterized protein n=1 Tax=Paenalkalicoccus suaedae TaxID=2592382 RepID=A0A859FC05_9BACI|nr:hypothetical protein [Paenalkalicoccus suaedae]QKS70480.1 hypothetical protein FLK61_27390 [Paenalkalicoccus suaedae]